MLRALLLGLLIGLLQPTPAADLPLLPPGTHVSALYSEAEPGAKTELDSAFGEVVAAGGDAYELSISWSDLESEPGKIDTSKLENYLSTLSGLNIHVYLSITTINTIALTLPFDLADAPALVELSGGRHFDDPLILDRFGKLLDAVVPVLAKHGGFFLSVGNEVEGWLDTHPDEVEPFARFVAAAREHVHRIEPRLGVGATITSGGVQRQSPAAQAVLAVSDAAAYTYYPLNDDFTVQAPSVAEDDLKQMVEAAGTLPILFQEVGYPSGYSPRPQNGSSAEKQRQFIENFFAAVEAYPSVRFVSVLQLADWSEAQCDAFADYYGLGSLPTAREFLCSLGLRERTGAAKPAYAPFLAAVRHFAAKRDT
jgi:hypothetical protein